MGKLQIDENNYLAEIATNTSRDIGAYGAWFISDQDQHTASDYWHAII